MLEDVVVGEEAGVRPGNLAGSHTEGVGGGERGERAPGKHSREEREDRGTSQQERERRRVRLAVKGNQVCAVVEVTKRDAKFFDTRRSSVSLQFS